ncbi:MogA/MoaB family molybdenum cofactor biosynthesis protein [Pseudodesulfovibrio sp. JC047]|uniref:MogA/MoaB family molybdenum cofactor biosynthesis protein n=1 Tax=Pseudodesulfovibrio sp. JC047 TaxID=2683199 RepID=UPI0013CF5C46|nr:MogA/MoaB family molybdenum cofactor biosynthesis protein [Pseudodesulfovibrio sp. JC047]NDV20059.1 MogA/MoaB family molybdenum cofactor biosynthesis protein [Pseudodesulfovibrio sp. JC047]
MSDSTFLVTVTDSLAQGDRGFLCSAGVQSSFSPIATADVLPRLRVGTRIVSERVSFIVQGVSWLPGVVGQPSSRVYLVEAVQDMVRGAHLCTAEREGYALAWITLSDKGSQGKRVDESGPLVGTLVREKLPLNTVQGFIIPDEISQLKGLLVDLALNQGVDLILTTGGTGVGPRDITPEATEAVIEKRLPGYERAMTAASLLKTPHGAISRAVAGTLGLSLIVNMPGSPRAVAECLEPLLPTLKHTLKKLQGDPSDCALLRKD